MHRDVKTADSADLGECPLCDDSMNADTSIDLGCGHRFCKACFSSWLVAALDKGPQALTTCCPGYKCTEVVPDDLFLDLLPEPKQKRLLSRWSLGHYVQAQPTLAWCVNPRCSHVVQYTAGGARDVQCDCGARFCFRCLFPESHRFVASVAQQLLAQTGGTALICFVYVCACVFPAVPASARSLPSGKRRPNPTTITAFG